jgi:hypothetical protein
MTRFWYWPASTGSKRSSRRCGDNDLGSVDAELFAELRASEDRIADRLSVIEGKLGVLLEQPCSIALGADQRTLLDAGVSADSDGRVRELRQARVYFREASTAARSRLQVATAERFLALCCLALREPDAAMVAMRASRAAALQGCDRAGRHPGAGGHAGDGDGRRGVCPAGPRSERAAIATQRHP